MKIIQVTSWICVLILWGACTPDRGTVIRKTPVKGMGGYEVITREAQEVERRVYQAEDIRVQELGSYESQPSAEPQEAPAELAPAPEEPASPEEPAPPSLRRQRIPLRRNRYLLLKQQSASPNK